MNKSDLQFIQSTLIMERLFGDPLSKRAQEGGNDGGVFNKIKTEVLKLIDFNKDHPVESILAFIGPGMLALLGFKKIAIAVTLAEALGFSWEHFFSSIRAKLEPMLHDMHENGTKKDSADVQAIVASAGEEAFAGKVDIDKLQEITEKYTSLNSMLFMMKVAQRYKKDPAMLQAIEKILGGATGNKFRKGMLGFIIRMVAWLVTAVLLASGLKLVGKAAAHILGTDKDKKEEGKTDSEVSPDSRDTAISDKEEASHPEDKNISLNLNHSANQDLFTTTYNDDSHVWVLTTISSSRIHENLIKWAQELYPQLTDVGAFDASASFNRTLRMFKERNKDATKLQVCAVPQPFKSIKEIVDSFAADVASHMAHSTENAGLMHA